MIDKEFTDFFLNELGLRNHQISDRQLQKALASDMFIAAVAKAIREAFPSGSRMVTGSDSVRWVFREHKITQRTVTLFGFENVFEFSLFTKEMLAAHFSWYGGKVTLARIEAAIHERDLDFARDTQEALWRRSAWYGRPERIPIRLAFLELKGFGIITSWLHRAGVHVLGSLVVRTRREVESFRLPGEGQNFLTGREVTAIEGVLDRYGLSFSEPIHVGI